LCIPRTYPDAPEPACIGVKLVSKTHGHGIGAPAMAYRGYAKVNSRAGVAIEAFPRHAIPCNLRLMHQTGAKRLVHTSPMEAATARSNLTPHCACVCEDLKYCEACEKQVGEKDYVRDPHARGVVARDGCSSATWMRTERSARHRIGAVDAWNSTHEGDTRVRV